MEPFRSLFRSMAWALLVLLAITPALGFGVHAVRHSPASHHSWDRHLLHHLPLLTGSAVPSFSLAVIDALDAPGAWGLAGPVAEVPQGPPRA
jgi:hypothetical protein